MVERLITELAEQPVEQQGEPWAWFVYVEEASNGYVVDDINDRQLIDDVTNHNAKVTPLYPIPDPRIAALEVELLTAIARMRTAIHMLDAGNTKGQVRLWLDGYCNTDMTEKQK